MNETQEELHSQIDRIVFLLTDRQRANLLVAVWADLPADVRSAALAAVTR